jgi:hypothetical protein
MYDSFLNWHPYNFLYGLWPLWPDPEFTGRRRMIYQKMLGPVQLDVLCETEDPPPYVRSLLCPPNEILIQTLRLKTHEETEDTTLSVPENAVVKRLGTLQHGGGVDPKDEDEDRPERKRPPIL